MNIQTTLGLIDRIIKAYNKVYDASLTPADIENIVLGPHSVNVNGKEVDWECIKLD